MRSYILTIVILLVSVNLYAQKNYNNWVFGRGAWIYFPDESSSPYFVEQAAINQVEGCTAYSDDAGNLLFYSDGETVWNNSHKPIINGTNLKGSWTASQGAFIFPKPGEIDKLYIITLGATEKKTEFAYYSIIDYSKGYDKAEVVEKNTILNANYDGERGSVIRKPNGDGFWLLLDDVSFPKFLIYDVNSTGISLANTYDGKMTKKDNHGVVKISTNGNLIISVNSDAPEFEICHFNPFEGKIYKSMVINSSVLGDNVQGADFSPNSRFIYMDGNKRYTSSWSTIFNQFDVIEYFKTKNAKFDNIVNETFSWRKASKEGIELAPNKKIYIASPETNYISCINAPNEKYPNCNYVKEAVDLKNTKSMLSLPSRVIEPKITYEFIDTVVCEDSDFIFNGEKYDGSFWITPNDGVLESTNLVLENFSAKDTGYYHLYSDIYDLKLILHVEFVTNDYNNYVMAYPDYYICPGDSTLILTSEDVERIEWKDGSILDSFYINKPGTYGFTVFLENGCVLEDEITIYRKNITPEIVTNQSHCESGVGELFLNSKYQSYEWNDGSTDDKLTITEGGIYWVKVTTHDGCVGYDTLEISFQEVKNYDILPDSLQFCYEELADYEITLKNIFKSIEWSHKKFGEYTIFPLSGQYSIIATDKNGCPHYDTVEVIIHDLIEMEYEELNNYFCVGDSGSVIIKNRDNTTIKWYDGQTNYKRKFAEPGTYIFTAFDTLTGCSQEIKLNFYNNSYVAAEIILSNNKIDCSTKEIKLSSKYKDKNYEYYWNGELGSDSLLVNESGEYNLRIVNKLSGCEDIATVNIKFLEDFEVEIDGNDSICKGGSTILKVNPYDENYNYTWSTGEGTEFIEVTIPGNYTVIADNGSCKDTAEFTVYQFEMPDVEILGESIICTNQSTTLSTKEKYEKYLWSTGETTSSIDVFTAGQYSVEVTDINGCIANGNFTISNYYLNYSVSDYLVDFGKMYVGDSKIKSITITNNSDVNIGLEFDNQIITIDEKYIYNPEFKANKLGIYNDTIEFKITSPCDSSFYIIKKAEVYAVAKLTTTNIKSSIGNRINIPFYIEGPNEIGHLNLDVQTNIKKDLFLSDNGLDFNSSITVTKDKQQIHSMPGKLLLTDFTISPIEFNSISSDNEFVEFINEPGKIEVDTICIFDLRNVVIFEEFESNIFKDNGNINITIKTNDESNIELRIYSIDGKLVYNKSVVIDNSDYTTFIPASTLSKGIYFIQVTDGYNTITKKVVLTD